MAFGLSEIIRWGLARLTGQQRTNGGTAVAALTSGGVLLDAGGATILTKNGTATALPGPVSVTGGTVTSNTPAFAISQTWNGAGQSFDGLQVAITNTASGTSAFPVNVLVNGSSIFSLRRDGYLAMQSGVAGAVFGLCGVNEGGPGAFRSLSNSGYYSIGAAVDVVIARGGPGILDQRNGTAAQRSRIFNTGDGTNGEWFDIDWQTTPNVATIGARAAGTGTLRPVTAIGNWTFNSQIVLPFAGGVGSTTGAGDGEWYLVAASINRVSMSDYGLTNGANIPVAWSSSATPNRALRDVAVGRNAAGVLEINNGTAGQFRDLRLRNLIASGSSRVIPVPVGSLPSASASGAGAEAIVNDALSPAWGATVAGGGAVTVGVRSNGTNWIVF